MLVEVLMGLRGCSQVRQKRVCSLLRPHERSPGCWWARGEWGNFTQGARFIYPHRRLQHSAPLILESDGARRGDDLDITF